MFPIKALGWSLGIFALLRGAWVEENLVLRLTRWQQGAAEFYAGPPAAPISVTVDCSGADVLALCLAAILAWPASWRGRLAGATGGLAIVAALNTARIATLGRAAASPALFQSLHLQIWPAILVLAVGGYTFFWMRVSRRGDDPYVGTSGRTRPAASFARRFAAFAALCLVAFALCGPWIARSETLLVASAWIAGEAALVLTSLGVAGATAAGPVLTTTRGAFMVTPECLATALVPLYLALVLAARLSWPRRLLALVAAPPFLAMLAIARVLLLALPPVLASSPLFLVHGFHQTVLALIVVGALAWEREPVGPGRSFRAAVRSGGAVAAGAAFATLAGGALTRTVTGLAETWAPSSRSLSDLAGPGDAQGALATLFAFQAAFLLAIGIATVARWPRLLGVFGALLGIQVVFLIGLEEIANRTGGMPHALLLRAWAVGLPTVLALLLLPLRPPAARSFLRLAPHGPA